MGTIAKYSTRSTSNFLTRKAVIPYSDGMGISDTFPKLASCGPDGVPALVDALIAEARRRRASDLHLEPGKSCVLARLRVDGVLEKLAELPLALAPNLAARCKILAGLLTYRLDIPQEGGFRDTIGEGRISTFPVVYGEKVVFRFFQSERLDDLANLGFDTAIVGGLMQALDLRDGMLLVTGPSGSGKTTTIYTCLQRLAAAGRQVCTLEDPVEREIAGITQSSIRPAAGFDFACGLRSLLRQDPDVIMIGEIRDRETAESALRAGLTGHMVIATIHASSASGAASRLLDMGLEPYLLTGSLRAVLHQRLVRRTIQADEQYGRFPLAELLIPGKRFRQAMLARADTDALEGAAVADGLVSLAEAARVAVTTGKTTLEEVVRALGAEIAGKMEAVRDMASPGK